MKNFFVTFGQQYSHTMHPYNFGKEIKDRIHPDGWVNIQAEDYEVARDKAFEVFGQKWAFLYEEGVDRFDKDLFPKGELFVIQA